MNELENLSSFASPHFWEKYYSLKPNDVFVEAGAFWGTYTHDKGASSKVGSSGKVILIEPESFNISVIKAVIKENNLKNVTLVEKVVWNKTAEVDFFAYNGESYLWHGISRVNTHNDFESYFETIKVQADTLDNILSSLNVDKVDLLACDVEGSEEHLVEGACKYFDEKRILNIALAAYHYGLYEKLLPIVKSKGFKDAAYDYDNGVIYGKLLV